MSRLAFIFRTDVHTADRSPDSWKADYPAEIWSNLEQIGELARKHDCAAVLDGGDFFHIKASTRNSHGLVVKVAEIHASYPCPVFSIEGNHDITYNNLESIDRQPLGVLFASGVFNLLRDHVFEDGNLKVRVVGMPYKVDRTLQELRAIRKQEGDTNLIALVHALAGEKPPDHVEDFFGEPVFRYDRLIAKNGPDCWCFGHWHRDQGIVEIKGRQFVNQGAVSRGALIKENLERQPKVALIEVTEEGVTVTPLPLKVAPASEVFDVAKKERREKEGAIIEQFAAKLQASGQIDPSEDIEASVRALGFDADIRDLALEYLERARSQ